MGDGEGSTSKKCKICSGVVSINALSPQGDMHGDGWGEHGMGHQAADALRPQLPLLTERMPGRAENSQSSSCLLVAPGGNFGVQACAPMLKLQISDISFNVLS